MKPILTIKIFDDKSKFCHGTALESEIYQQKKKELNDNTELKLGSLESCKNKCTDILYKTGNSELCDYNNNNNNNNNNNELLKISYNNIRKVKMDNKTINCKDGIKQINDIINENNNNIIYTKLIKIFPLHILSSKRLEECLVAPITKSESIFEIDKGEASSKKIIDIFSQQITNIYTMKKITGVTLDTFIQNMTDENELDYIIIQLFYILLYANINGYYQMI